MDKEIQVNSQLNEFRQDLVSGEWVLFATERAKRPEAKQAGKESPDYKSKENCRFEDPMLSDQEVLWFYPSKENWEIAVIKNKYPALKPGICQPAFKKGPFNTSPAIGSHDVVVYKNHNVHFADFSVDQLVSAIKVYKKRYSEIISEGGDCVEYISIFHNFGKEAGSSIYHPHSQIISMPILPPDVARSLHGSHEFYKNNGQRIYDLLVQLEKEEGKRIIYENEAFIVFCPFVSKYPYEVRIFPKDSHAHFEKLEDIADKYLADAMKAVFLKMKKALNDPPYNFFIHTASVKDKLSGKFHEFYTWHIEIIPKLSTMGGLELGTGIDVNPVDPDQAAKLLRETQI